MKKFFVSLGFGFLVAVSAASAAVSGVVSGVSVVGHSFEDFFEPSVLRLDYTQAGGMGDTIFLFDKLVRESVWAGPKTGSALVDTMGLGNQCVRMYELSSGKLIYQKGYNTLFGEWLTTPEARLVKRGYRESVVMPCPRVAVRVELLLRGRDGRFTIKYSQNIEPSVLGDVTRVGGEVGSAVPVTAGVKYPVFDVHYSGAPSKCLDIVLLGEGYTANQRERFEEDCAVFAKSVLEAEPYKSRARSINIRGVWCPSADQGATSPVDNMWCNTALGSSYNTFGMDRYIMIEDYQRVRDVAASAPYDYIYVLANTPKYGGGAIYNFYGISAASHARVGAIYLHELGHLLAGLGDEYQGNVSFDGAYGAAVEPWEYNLTTLADFHLKRVWGGMLFDNANVGSGSGSGSGSKAQSGAHGGFEAFVGGVFNGAANGVVGGAVEPRNFTVKGSDVGVFEGGGYSDYGVFRPAERCMMRHMDATYCLVCMRTLEEVIDSYR